MGSISDALKRAEQERRRMHAGEVQGVAPPTQPLPAPPAAPAESPRLASVVLKAAEKPKPTPTTPLTAAIQQTPQVAPAAKRQQEIAETIVEDYASKQRLNLPAGVAVYHDRTGRIAEQYRKTRQRLLEANPQREPQALVFTASAPGEGATTSVLNLGLSLVEQRGLRVLLIDADLHAAGLSRLLRMRDGLGLSELLLGEVDQAALTSAVRATPWHNLYVLPAGGTSPPQGSAELLKLPAARALLRQARGMFNWVLIDTPPAGKYPDAGVLGAFSDGMVLTVSLRHTGRELVHKTLRRLEAMSLPLRGCLLTHAGE